MNLQWVKTPGWVKRYFSILIWEGPSFEKTVYLTFDDGPTPEITPWVIEQLAAYNYKATFFLIGDNIQKYPHIAHQLVEAGHAIGNHTFNHWNGWKYSTQDYLANTLLCAQEIEKITLNKTHLFRPPYGKIKWRQIRNLRQLNYSIIMWDILTNDWDATKTPEFCLKTITKHVQPGSIIVFHDSKKAFCNLKEVLPKALEYLSENGFRSEKLT